ncbi:Serine/threonine-protein kinase StkP [Pontiella desulfatans]|uniref:Serine/threonine-protein kinase StkP n=1 Tax=Pontiella desulfatans TaxID=2750659 RepID=A0A6C2U7U5_PONDE|nr:bifunctional serine/threonine-protein kinase/formylglycine-generating enzyme family protein [Pontiella desulfatans]VGO15591.1 Serine/threonine-protein kinase StkP [Pontiella desulfatans]
MDEPIDLRNADTIPLGQGEIKGYSLAAGDMLGQYCVVGVLGKGGMGQVYKVVHTTLGRHYALKLLAEDFGRFSFALHRFRREAKVMANIEHPNIIHVDEFGQTDGRYWLRMELAEGIDGAEEFQAGNVETQTERIVSLSDLAKTMGGKVPQEMLLPILVQILDGLDYAHARGAVHRDLKPANILFCGKNGSVPHVKITDFGLVRLLGEEWLKTMMVPGGRRSMSGIDHPAMDLDTATTSSEPLLGTYRYMSPEQKRGEEGDERSDIYSIGLIIYYLLTGEELGLRTPSQLDSSIDPAWDALVFKALENHPDKRFQSVSEMIAALGGLERGEEQRPIPVTGEEAQGNEESSVAEDEAPSCPSVQGSSAGGGSTKEPSTASPTKPKGTSSRAKHQRPKVMPGLLIAVAIYVGGFLLIRHNAAETPRVEHAGQARQNFSLDLGGSQRMEFVWIPALNGWAGKYEVTNGEYRSLVPRHDSGKCDEGSLDGNRQPVVEVSWDDAQKFIRLIKDSHGLPEGYDLTLPSREEWMKVAQCGDRSQQYPWGSGWPPKNGNYAAVGFWDQFPATCPVEDSGRNIWGMYGVGGNVWEWTRDKAGFRKYIICGASWGDSDKERLRCTGGGGVPFVGRNNIGFRLFLLPLGDEWTL